MKENESYVIYLITSRRGRQDTVTLITTRKIQNTIKAFKTILNKRIRQYLEINNKLPDTQHGF